MRRIRALREAQPGKPSQAEMARRTGMHPSTISLIESGRLVPGHDQLSRLAAALGWQGDPAALFEDVHDDARR